MASKSKIAKANRMPKFSTCQETRCNCCGRVPEASIASLVCVESVFARTLTPAKSSVFAKLAGN